jgi:glucose-1-phosphate adenylyltransferase
MPSLRTAVQTDFSSAAVATASHFYPDTHTATRYIRSERPAFLAGTSLQRAPMRDVLALVLAGGRGTRLGALTARRAKPAVPMAGRHRIIDFTLSNCFNSGIQHIGVLTQYMADSLTSCLDTWNTDISGPIVKKLAAPLDSGYLGTADAVHQNRHMIRNMAPSHVLVLAADHVYQMDYATMLAEHVRRRAQVTVGCVEVPIAVASYFGVMEVDADKRIKAFVEKPKCPKPMPGCSDMALASMGIYIFDTDFLLTLLAADAENPKSEHDFGKNVIPAAVAAERAYAHSLRDIAQPSKTGYWRDVGTVDAYWHTNLELARSEAAFDLHSPDWPMYGSNALNRSLVAARRPRSFANTIVAEGCAIEGAEIRDSVLSSGIWVGAGTLMEQSIVLPGAIIGSGCVIRNAIVDENCRLPAGTIIGFDIEEDRRRYDVTASGIVLVSG